MSQRSKKLIAVFTLVLLMFSLVLPNNMKTVYAEDEINQAKGEEKDIKVVEVLSFNDFHGSVLESGKNIGSVKLSGVINEYKSKSNENYGVIPVSAGDIYQGSAISNIKYGSPVTDMLNAIGLEASAIGNHEFDWGTDHIATWAKEGNFDFLAANLVKKGTDTIVDYAKPYKIVERNGVKFAFIGIATPETADKTLAANVKNVEFLDPATTVEKYEKIVRAEGANVVIALSHSAAIQDKDTKEITGEAADIAKVKGVDAVIAGHNHAFVSGKVNGVPVVEGGYNGRGLGKLKFTFDNTNKLISIEPSNEIFKGKESTLPVDKDLEVVINKHRAELEPLMAEVVTSIDERLSHDDYKKSVTPLGVTVAETMRQITGTDIAITNGGGVRRSLEKGEVKKGDMYELLPFDNTLVTIELKGEDIVKAIEHGINTKDFGWGQFAGIKAWYDSETGKVSSIRLNDGSKLDMDKYYTVTINDFMTTGGDGYNFDNAKNIKDTYIVMRDAMSNNWKENGGVPKIDYNVLIAGEDNTDAVVKPETPSEDIPANKPVEESKPTVAKKPAKLPQTGTPITPDGLAMLGMISIGVGAILKKKKSA